MNLDVANDAKAWGDFLQALAREADSDAESIDQSLALHGVLRDLANVARAYAGRIEIERGQYPVEPDPIAVEQEIGEPLEEEPEQISGAVSMQIAPEALLPDWLMSALQSMGAEIEALKRRVELLEANEQRSFVQPSVQYTMDTEAPLDDDRTAWNTTERARAALRSMLARHHQALVRTRQLILSRVTALAVGERTPDTDAELRQHRARAAEYGEIDAVLGRKFDEIAGMDDLDELRSYDVEAGFPS